MRSIYESFAKREYRGEYKQKLVRGESALSIFLSAFKVRLVVFHFKRESRVGSFNDLFYAFYKLYRVIGIRCHSKTYLLTYVALQPIFG
jgi:hypothetical protein